jgi:hypothetical protein
MATSISSEPHRGNNERLRQASLVAGKRGRKTTHGKKIFFLGIQEEDPPKKT